jgi:hypothetical protein
MIAELPQRLRRGPALRPFTPIFENRLARTGWGAQLGKDPLQADLSVDASRRFAPSPVEADGKVSRTLAASGRSGAQGPRIRVDQLSQRCIVEYLPTIKNAANIGEE